MPYTAAETETRIRSMEIVSGHPQVAIRLIELSKDPQAELEEYSQLIETDAGLASRMLALVNSAWFAPSHPVQTIKRAVCTLGLGQVRIIALSHCVASLHKSIELGREDSRAMWAASMCKAIAARKVCEALSPEHASEAFTTALLQDLGLALFRSMEPKQVSELLCRVELDPEQAAAAERELFGMTHARAGSCMARQLGLPDHYADLIGGHHAEIDDEKEREATPIQLACKVAALLPHDIRFWTRSDMDELRRVIEEHELSQATLEEFMQSVQLDFAETDQCLNDGADAADLMECLAYASEENARAASVLVAQNSSLMVGTGRLQAAVDLAERGKRLAESRAEKDPLTDLLNRNGWDRRAKLTLRQAQGSSRTVGMAFIDLDNFKETNDEHGHRIGDLFLSEVGERIKDAVRAEDLVCRWGGDEFVILFQGVDEDACVDAMMRVKSHIESAQVHCEGLELPVSSSVGFVIVNASSSKLELEALLQQADESLYRAKATERGSVVVAIAD